jgi:UDP-glucuronate 4-epimerase
MIRDDIYYSQDNFQFHTFDIALDDWAQFKQLEIFAVIHLAAQAGVRYSLVAPDAYIVSNIVGFQKVIDFVKTRNIEKFLYASSSSVYGKNPCTPFNEEHCVRCPESLYAATKISNELVATAYFNTFKVTSIGMRFFTVYGPWGRPDMAPMIFANSVVNGTSIDLFNYGLQRRDFTYIDDVVESVFRLFQFARFDKSEFVNIGSENPIELLDFVKVIEDYLGLESIKNLLPPQVGDVISTSSDCSKLRLITDFSPVVDVKRGMASFLEWFLKYYKYTSK